MRLLLVVFSVLIGCGGGGNGSDCHATSDCDEGLACSGVDDPPVCGIAPNEGCVDDNSCAGTRCHAVSDNCSADGIGSECRQACTGDTECGQGFRCDAGACVAILCDEIGSLGCAAREVCDPSRIVATTPIYDRTSGCFPVACESDATCGERFCVNGTCQDAIGTCVIPMLVP